MSLANLPICLSDSSNGGLLAMLLYMSCGLSSLRFPIVQMRVPFGLCSVVCDGFVGCWVSSYLLVGWMSRSRLIGVVENVRLVDLHPSFVIGFTEGALLSTWRGFCVLCLYACNASGPFSLSMIVESSCKACPSVLRKALVPRCGLVNVCVCS
jgi:hypothetical protein